MSIFDAKLFNVDYTVLKDWVETKCVRKQKGNTTSYLEMKIRLDTPLEQSNTLLHKLRLLLHRMDSWSSLTC